MRIGDTVRPPHQPTSFAVAGHLDHLERVGFDGAPRYLGRDAQQETPSRDFPQETSSRRRERG